MLLYPDTYFHIYNHAIGKEILFNCDENYYFFIKKYYLYINPVAKTLAYCLMPNHIHFLIRTRKESELNQLENISTYKNIETYISKQFSNLFSSYTQAFNKVNQRRGNLFISNFQRKIIDNEIYLDNLIFYIHNNPVNHNFASKIEDWKYSSYPIYKLDQNTFLEKDFVYNLFNSKDNFIEFHQNKQEFDKISQVIID